MHPQGHQAYAEGILMLLRQRHLPRDPSITMILRVLDSIHDGIVVVDRSSRIIFANHGYQRIFGVPVAKVLGRRLADIEPGVSLLKTLDTGQPLLHDFVQVKSVGKQIVCNHTPVLDENGELFGAVATFLDVSECVEQRQPLGKVIPLAARPATAKVAGITHPTVPDAHTLPVPFRQLLGKNVKFLQALDLAFRAAQCDCTILIRGESGVGKELLAKAIHAESRRRSGPLVVVNCAAIPEALLESELFGYEDGAFTGARRGGRPGKFELAHGGTMFLDEVGEMPLSMQAKVLRVLQERWVERIGGVKGCQVDVQVIAATNQDLEGMMALGQFREDLYYRLNVVPIVLPPLRERRDDILQIAENLLQSASQNRGIPLCLSQQARECLLRHHWPGNVRELQNALEYAAVMSRNGQILPEHLPDRITRAPGSGAGGEQFRALKGVLKATEKRAFVEALDRSKGNHTRAIAILGISRGAFYKKLRAYGLDRRD